MAVQSNVTATNVSNSTMANEILLSSVSSGDKNVNGLIKAIRPSGIMGDDKKNRLQHIPVRVVHTMPASNDSSTQQPQVVRIIKHTPDRGNPSKSSIFNIKSSLTSPIKAGTVFNIPSGTARLLTQPGTKLKVGDTITIPKASLVHDVSTASLSSVGGQTMSASSTPTKLLSIPGLVNNPMFVSSPASTNKKLTPMTTVIQSNTSFAHQVGSPDRLTTISPSWTQSPTPCKRASVYMDSAQHNSESKRRRAPNSTEKGSKGLRHFAMLVCEKVKQKMTTTYNEVADELVSEYGDTQRHMSDQHYDQKNIRRRVYDALNVLMAMDIIYKDKKDIHWVGLPTNSAQEIQTLQSEKKKREQRIQQKTVQLQELILQQIAFKNLVQRNKRLQQTQGPPTENSSIQLPFIIVNTSKKTVIDCSISNDKHEYMFNFDNTFEIHDDIEVLKRMGMAYGLEAGTCTRENLRTAQTLVPPVLKPYLEEMAGISKQSSEGETTAAIKYTLQDAPRIVAQTHFQGSQVPYNNASTQVKMELDSLELTSCFSLQQRSNNDDREVGMVTDGSQTSDNSSGIAMGCTSSSSSSHHNGFLSLASLSSCEDSESRESTPMDPSIFGS